MDQSLGSPTTILYWEAERLITHGWETQLENQAGRDSCGSTTSRTR